ncbi:MAG: ribose 5-phosphate isomerase B [Deltaproteobacteria bacterium]|nr:ribose 5-phosphate isomerase B [Deltaproteobacteria bacterium]
MALEKIIIGADHAGYGLKEALKPVLAEMGLAVTDIGTNCEASVDYPDYAGQVGEAVSRCVFPRGILLCGSGVGMSIVANRFPGVRAALCRDEETARLSRMHNDANVLVLAARMTDPETAFAIVRTWLSTPFEGGRHQRRIDKIRETECRDSGEGTGESWTAKQP